MAIANKKDEPERALSPIQPHLRAHSTLQYSSPALADKHQLTKEKRSWREGFRLKKVGNLTTLERVHPVTHAMHLPAKRLVETSTLKAHAAFQSTP